MLVPHIATDLQRELKTSSPKSPDQHLFIHGSLHSLQGWTEFLISGNVHLTGGVDRDSHRQTNEGDARRGPGCLDPKQKDNERVAGHASQGTHSWHHVNKSPRWNGDSCIDEGLADKSPEMGT